MRHERLIFFIIVLTSALGSMASDVYLPSLPAIARALHTDFSAAKFSVSIYMVGFALSPLVYGPLSDGIGRRKPLVIGLVVCLLGSIVCASASNIYLLIIGRLLQGIGGGAGSSLFRPMLRDLFTMDKLSKYGSYAALISISVLSFAPLLGGYLQHYFNWRATFVFLSAYAALLLLAIFILVPETNAYLHRDNLRWPAIKYNFTLLITSRVFMGYSFLSFLAYAAIFSWLTTGPIVMEQVMGITPVGFGWVYAVSGIGFFIGALFNSRGLFYFGANNMLRLGLVSMLLASVLMLGFKWCGLVNIYVIIVPISILLFGAALVFPNAFAGAFQPFPKTAGMAGALFGCLGPLGGVIASSLLALVHDSNQIPMGLAMLICSVLAWGIVICVLKKG